MLELERINGEDYFKDESVIQSFLSTVRDQVAHTAKLDTKLQKIVYARNLLPITIKMKKYPGQYISSTFALSAPRHLLEITATPVATNDNDLDIIINNLSKDLAEIYLSLFPEVFPFRRSVEMKVRRKTTTENYYVSLTNKFRETFAMLCKNEPNVMLRHRLHNTIDILTKLVNEVKPIAHSLLTGQSTRSMLTDRFKDATSKSVKWKQEIDRLQIRIKKLENSITSLNNWNKESFAYKSGKISALKVKKELERQELERSFDMMTAVDHSVERSQLTTDLQIVEDRIADDTRLLKEGVLEICRANEILLGLAVTRKYKNMLNQTKW